MQVLLGLQSNALKFIEEGKVEISTQIITIQDQDGHTDDEVIKKFIEISVIDTGVGIPYHDQDKLFKLFRFV